MKVRLNGISLLVAAAALSMVAPPAFAGFAQGNKVTMGGNPVFAIAGSADGFSPDHRAWVTQDRLDNALVLSFDKTPSAVNVEKRNGAWTVTLGGRTVASADYNSANLEGKNAHDLANEWAQGIKNFLSDSTATTAYVAELTGANPINANVAILERRIYAPAGTILPVAFTTALSSETIKAGDRVEGKLTRDVAFGNFVLPAGATVIGAVQEQNPGEFVISFSSLRLASGTEVPIAASLSGEYLVGTHGPKAVCTLSMPAGMNVECRTPATMGIGTLGGPGQRALVIRRGSNLSIAPGAPVTLVFDQVTPVPVAVIARPAM